MRNLTLAIHEDLLAAARRYAADHNTTVNKMVREYLQEVVAQDSRRRRSADRMRRNLERIHLEVGPRDWGRTDLYER